MINKIYTCLAIYNYSGYNSFIENINNHMSVGINKQSSGDTYITSKKVISKISFFIRFLVPKIYYKIL